jgi:hypothetical protein
MSRFAMYIYIYIYVHICVYIHVYRYLHYDTGQAVSNTQAPESGQPMHKLMQTYTVGIQELTHQLHMHELHKVN